jgi:hypothetical protein
MPYAFGSGAEMCTAWLGWLSSAWQVLGRAGNFCERFLWRGRQGIINRQRIQGTWVVWVRTNHDGHWIGFSAIPAFYARIQYSYF